MEANLAKGNSGKRYTPEEKTRLLSEWHRYRQDGMSEVRAAEEVGVTATSLKAWNKTLNPAKGDVKFYNANQKRPYNKKPKPAPSSARFIAITGTVEDVISALRSL